MFRWISNFVETRINLHLFKEDLRKIGVNFITAGIVGVFVNHIAGFDLHNMQLSAIVIASIGVICLIYGLRNRRK